jgi:hypothetical protein
VRSGLLQTRWCARKPNGLAALSGPEEKKRGKSASVVAVGPDLSSSTVRPISHRFRVEVSTYNPCRPRTISSFVPSSCHVEIQGPADLPRRPPGRLAPPLAPLEQGLGLHLRRARRLRPRRPAPRERGQSRPAVRARVRPAREPPDRDQQEHLPPVPPRPGAVARCDARRAGADARAQSWVLYYTLIGRHLEELMPIIYTPTEADAISNYSHLFRRAEGLYLSFPNADTMEADYLEQTRGRDIDLVVVSDGEAILGIGDQGVGVSRLAVYAADDADKPCRRLECVYASCVRTIAHDRSRRSPRRRARCTRTLLASTRAPPPDNEQPRRRHGPGQIAPGRARRRHEQRGSAQGPALRRPSPISLKRPPHSRAPRAGARSGCAASSTTRSWTSLCSSCARTTRTRSSTSRTLASRTRSASSRATARSTPCSTTTCACARSTPDRMRLRARVAARARARSRSRRSWPPSA